MSTRGRKEKFSAHKLTRWTENRRINLFFSCFMVRQSFVVEKIEMLEDITSRKYPSINHRWWSKKRRLPPSHKNVDKGRGWERREKRDEVISFAFCDLLWRNIFMALQTFHLTQEKKAEFYKFHNSMLKWIKIKRIYKLKFYSEHSAFICELISHCFNQTAAKSFRKKL